MTKFYSKTAAGFFDSALMGSYEAAGTWPLDAVEVAENDYALLLAGQSQGKRIVADAAGLPILADPPASTLADIKAELVGAVDAHFDAIYGVHRRFKVEYDKREPSARAYVAAGGVGVADSWVQSVADAQGISALSAANLIIGQADGLWTALELLAAQRMRKYGITAAVDAAAAQSLHDDIVGQADLVAAGL